MREDAVCFRDQRHATEVQKRGWTSEAARVPRPWWGAGGGCQKQIQAPALLQVDEQRPLSIKVMFSSLSPAAGLVLPQDLIYGNCLPQEPRFFISEKALGQVTWNLWAIA